MSQVATGPRVIRISNADGFQVIGLPQLSPQFRVRAEAEKWLRAALAKAPESRRPRTRACLCCGRSFDSEGFHNRLCGPCRHHSEPFGSASLARASAPGRLSSATRRMT